MIKNARKRVNRIHLPKKAGESLARIKAICYNPGININTNKKEPKAMSKKSGIILSILCVAAIALSAVSLVFGLNASKGTQTQNAPETQEAQESGDIQYVLYLGTNDKDTNEPVFAPDEAKAQAEKILLEHFGGYTIQEANGGWVDGDITYTEYTLVIYLSDTDIDSVHAAADDMIKAFNQSSVLIQANQTETEFYAG